LAPCHTATDIHLGRCQKVILKRPFFGILCSKVVQNIALIIERILDVQSYLLIILIDSRILNCMNLSLCQVPKKYAVRYDQLWWNNLTEKMLFKIRSTWVSFSVIQVLLHC
jgi:hypothetical protein